jgi:hypothetical protein
MSDRYIVMGQIFIVDGTAVISTTGRKVADTNFTCVGAGNFTVWMANGTTGTLSGTNVQGTPVALAAGLNTITTTGAVADGVIDITIGTAANTNTVNSCSAASGGQCGASIPTSADNLYGDSNSFTAGSQVLTVDAALNVLDLDFTGATNSPTLTGANWLNIYGNTTLISAMTFSVVHLDFLGAGTFQPAGLVFASTVHFIIGSLVGTFELLGDLSTQLISVDTCTFDTGGYDITCTSFETGGAGAKTITLGDSIINCTSWDMVTGGGAVTLTANTATINCSGNFAGSSLDYNGATVNLTGATSTVTGNNEFATLGFTRAGVQTISFTDGTTQTVTALARDAGTSVKTLQGTSTAGWAIAAAGAATHLDYISLLYSAASPANKFYYGIGSTVGIGNSGWQPYQSNVFGTTYSFMGTVA